MQSNAVECGWMQSNVANAVGWGPCSQNWRMQSNAKKFQCSQLYSNAVDYIFACIPNATSGYPLRIYGYTSAKLSVDMIIQNLIRISVIFTDTSADVKAYRQTWINRSRHQNFPLNTEHKSANPGRWCLRKEEDGVKTLDGSFQAYTVKKKNLGILQQKCLQP